MRDISFSVTGHHRWHGSRSGRPHAETVAKPWEEVLEAEGARMRRMGRLSGKTVDARCLPSVSTSWVSPPERVRPSSAIHNRDAPTDEDDSRYSCEIFTNWAAGAIFSALPQAFYRPRVGACGNGGYRTTRASSRAIRRVISRCVFRNRAWSGCRSRSTGSNSVSRT